MNLELKTAVKTLSEALRDDPEYFRAWQASIAMSFKDEFQRRYGSDEGQSNSMHSLANAASENFLNSLTQNI